MANRNTQGFGLVPAGSWINSSDFKVKSKYKIDAGETTCIFQNGAVDSSAGYIIDGQTTDAPILGVLNGIFYNDATTLKPTFSNHYVQVTPANRRYRCICIR